MILYQESNSQSNYNYNIVIYDNVEWQLHFHKNFEIVYVMDGEVIANIGGLETVNLPLCCLIKFILTPPTHNQKYGLVFFRRIS